MDREQFHSRRVKHRRVRSINTANQSSRLRSNDRDRTSTEDWVPRPTCDYCGEPKEGIYRWRNFCRHCATVVGWRMQHWVARGLCFNCKRPREPERANLTTCKSCDSKRALKTGTVVSNTANGSLAALTEELHPPNTRTCLRCTNPFTTDSKNDAAILCEACYAVEETQPNCPMCNSPKAPRTGKRGRRPILCELCKEKRRRATARGGMRRLRPRELSHVPEEAQRRGAVLPDVDPRTGEDLDYRTGTIRLGRAIAAGQRSTDPDEIYDVDIQLGGDIPIHTPPARGTAERPSTRSEGASSSDNPNPLDDAVSSTADKAAHPAPAAGTTSGRRSGAHVLGTSAPSDEGSEPHSAEPDGETDA